MQHRFIGLLTIALIIGGCSQKRPHATQLEDREESNINIRILDRQNSIVPKDKFFYGKNWHYRQHTHNKYNFFRNDEIVGSFYLAHHATHIYIWGTRTSIKRYKRYFLENQVTAEIKFIPLLRNKKGHIRIDYFSLVNGAKMPIYGNSDQVSKKAVKEVLKANTDVVEIPKNFVKDFR